MHGAWLAERKLLLKGIYLAGGQVARTPVMLENSDGELER